MKSRNTLPIKLVRTVELSMMATTAGFDGILIDMEHSTFDLDMTSMFYRPSHFCQIKVIQASYA
jgi:2-keto-3-deoxy-L-rhamnonate aldolase RhmA